MDLEYKVVRIRASPGNERACDFKPALAAMRKIFMRYPEVMVMGTVYKLSLTGQKESERKSQALLLSQEATACPGVFELVPKALAARCN